MPELNLFKVPLSYPPDGYGWDERSMSELSTTTAFRTGLNQRDTFLGVGRCVVCGISNRTALEHCHIIMQSEVDVWSDLHERGWVPSRAKEDPSHEPRNGLRMCSLHHDLFGGYQYFIRYVPDVRKFVLFNHSEEPSLAQYHGKAIALDVGHRHAPFPALFIIHEMRVRGFHPFRPSVHHIPDAIQWQDWICSSGILRSNPNEGFFNSERPRRSASAHTPSSLPPRQQQFLIQANGTSLSSQGPTLELNNGVIAAILAATRESASWRACQMEGTSWDGTAEENRAQYMSLFPAEDSLFPEKSSLSSEESSS